MRALYYVGKGVVYLTAFLVGVTVVATYTGSFIAGGAAVLILMSALEELLDRVYRSQPQELGRWAFLWIPALVVPFWMASEFLGIVPTIHFTLGVLLRLIGGLFVGGVIMVVVGVSIKLVQYLCASPEERESMTS